VQVAQQERAAYLGMLQPAAAHRVVGLECLVTLRHAFHDATNAYLATDFYAGGDLCGLSVAARVFPRALFAGPPPCIAWTHIGA
jgi:hypothetical protein